jgi:TrmH family RNA methyltransferase
MDERLINAARISSRTNPLVKSLAALKTAKGRRDEGLFMAEGIKLAEEASWAVKNHRLTVKYVLLLEDEARKAPRLADAAASLVDAGAECIFLSEPAFDKITTESAPQGIITVCALPDTHNSGDVSENERLLILDGVQDPGNLGTVMRSAAALGWDRVILSDTADPYSPKTLRASMGSVFRLKVELSDDAASAAQRLRSQGRRIVKADIGEGCVPLEGSALSWSDCLVIGNEGHGISPALDRICDLGVTIPMHGGVESLNASAAAAIILWEYSKV